MRREVEMLLQAHARASTLKVCPSGSRAGQSTALQKKEYSSSPPGRAGSIGPSASSSSTLQSPSACQSICIILHGLTPTFHFKTVKRALALKFSRKGDMQQRGICHASMRSKRVLPCCTAILIVLKKNRAATALMHPDVWL